MYISAIGHSYNTDKNYKNKQSFKSLIKDTSVYPAIINMSKQDKVLLRQMKKRMSKTKFWDMKISCLKNKFNDLKFEFINKRNKNEVITDGIFPYAKKDNTISVYSIVYGPQNIAGNITKTLQFKSKERADQLYEKYEKNLENVRYKNYNLSTSEILKSKEIELKMLEESSKFADKSDKTKFVNADMQTKPFVGNDLDVSF